MWYDGDIESKSTEGISHLHNFAESFFLDSLPSLNSPIGIGTPEPGMHSSNPRFLINEAIDCPLN